jgi:hypothetical protein
MVRLYQRLLDYETREWGSRWGAEAVHDYVHQLIFKIGAYLAAIVLCGIYVVLAFKQIPVPAVVVVIGCLGVPLGLFAVSGVYLVRTARRIYEFHGLPSRQKPPITNMVLRSSARFDQWLVAQQSKITRR